MHHLFLLPPSLFSFSIFLSLFLSLFLLHLSLTPSLSLSLSLSDKTMRSNGEATKGLVRTEKALKCPLSVFPSLSLSFLSLPPSPSVSLSLAPSLPLSFVSHLIWMIGGYLRGYRSLDVRMTG
jgi:hypothetical protein